MWLWAKVKRKRLPGQQQKHPKGEEDGGEERKIEAFLAGR
jgi:hypothetical protein